MKLTQKNKSTIEKMHLISGENKGSIRNFFESMLILIVMDYLEEGKTNIPFIGDFKIKHLKDEYTRDGNEAVIELDFDADNNLLKNIGQIKDKTDPDILQIFKNRVRESLGDYFD